MKDVVKVSISGVGFTLSHDAYIVLKSYLYKLEKCYAENSDGKEIVSDIESRIVELILSHQSAEESVEQSLVQSIIDQLGIPEDELNSVMNDQNKAEQSDESSFEKFPRRLYRNPEGAKFGGVCNGIATFFHTDVVWIRSIFFLPLLAIIMFGWFDWDKSQDFSEWLLSITTLLYFVMWVIVPMARTARQKLEMNGEQITASSIHRSFTKDAIRMTSAKSSKVANVMAELLSLVGRLIILFIKALAVVFGLMLSLAAISIVVLVVSLIFGVGNTTEYVTPLYDFVSAGTLISIVSTFTLVVILPIIAIVWFLVALIDGVKKMGKITLVVLLAVWFASVVYLGIVVVSNFGNLEQGFENVVTQITLVDVCEQDDVCETVVTESVVEESIQGDTVNITIEK